MAICKKSSIPSRQRSCTGTIAGTMGLLVSGIYLLNPTAGIDLLPDALPGVGNLDEVFFTMVFLSCLAYFGLEIPLLSRRYGIEKIHNQKSNSPGETNLSSDSTQHTYEAESRKDTLAHDKNGHEN